MAAPQEKRAVIYPYNTEKAAKLVAALNMKSETEMVNYLIETTNIEQMTKITFENKKTNKKFSITRSTSYDPKRW